MAERSSAPGGNPVREKPVALRPEPDAALPPISSEPSFNQSLVIEPLRIAKRAMFTAEPVPDK